MKVSRSAISSPLFWEGTFRGGLKRELLERACSGNKRWKLS